MFIVTALPERPCDRQGLGNYISTLSVKNKQDYADVHGYEFLWKAELVNRYLPGPWNKVSILRHLLNTLDAQRFPWVLWVDYDAIIPNMTFVLPFDRYVAVDIIAVVACQCPTGMKARTWSCGSIHGCCTKAWPTPCTSTRASSSSATRTGAF